jgi:hypothetical protein
MDEQRTVRAKQQKKNFKVDSMEDMISLYFLHKYILATSEVICLAQKRAKTSV